MENPFVIGVFLGCVFITVSDSPFLTRFFQSIIVGVCAGIYSQMIYSILG